MPTKFVFLLLPELQILDLAGAEQVFSAAQQSGCNFEIIHCSIFSSVRSSTGLSFNQLLSYKKVELNPGDYLFIPGPLSAYLISEDFKAQNELFNWVRAAHKRGVNMCSICTGSYVFAYAGILENQRCTTHWQKIPEMLKTFPGLRIEESVLFTKQDNLYTSAGIASGIDMALFILEEIMGGYFAHKVARELVIYNRRNGNEPQRSNFMNYRNHIHSGIHSVQDWIHEHLDQKVCLSDLAEIANMSERNFTRIFKKETGITVMQYVTALRKERIMELLKNPDYSRKQIAQKCGLDSERQINRIIKDH